MYKIKSVTNNQSNKSRSKKWNEMQRIKDDSTENNSETCTSTQPSCSSASIFQIDRNNELNLNQLSPKENKTNPSDPDIQN